MNTTGWIAVLAIPLIIVLGTLGLASVVSKVYGPFSPVLFNHPAAVAVDSDGYVFVADTRNHRIQKFTSDGMLIRTWGGEGKADGKFQRPLGIAVDSYDDVYVSDSGNHRVQKFSNKGIFLDKWGPARCEIHHNYNCVDPDGPNGPLSIGDGQFHFPWGITVDKYDNIYVVDASNHRIQMFTKSGGFIGKWGSFGDKDIQFKFPTDITIDSSGYAYVTDHTDHSIKKFIPRLVVPNQPVTYGILVDKWGQEGTQLGYFNYPIAIDHDLSNYLYVIDSRNDRVQKFSSDGTPIGEWGVYGNGNKEFHLPEGIALNRQGTNVYVADWGNHRIQKFTHSGDFLTKWGAFGIPPVIIYK